MIKLEQTIIQRAGEHLAEVKAFYAKFKAGPSDDDDQSEYQNAHASLYALLEFGHYHDSGMSDEGRDALLAVEEDAAAVMRNFCASSTTALPIGVRYQDGRTGTVDVSKAKHTLVLGAFEPKQS